MVIESSSLCEKNKIELWWKTQEISFENTLENSPFDMEVLAQKQVEKNTIASPTGAIGENHFFHTYTYCFSLLPLPSTRGFYAVLLFEHVKGKHLLITGNQPSHYRKESLRGF